MGFLKYLYCKGLGACLPHIMTQYVCMFFLRKSLFCFQLCVKCNNASRDQEADKRNVSAIMVTRIFAVYKSKVKVRGEREVDIYQAVEFRAGQDVPLKLRNGMTAKEHLQIWVKGMYLAPAARIRRAHPELPRDRYNFQKDTGIDWEPALQYKL